MKKKIKLGSHVRLRTEINFRWFKHLSVENKPKNVLEENVHLHTLGTWFSTKGRNYKGNNREIVYIKMKNLCNPKTLKNNLLIKANW